MTRRLIAAIVATGCAVAVVWLTSATDLAARQNAQGGAAPSTPPAGPVPRLADGRPDLSGVWWGGADVGAARGRGARGGGRGARGGGRGAGGARGTPPPTFQSLYKPE